MSDFKIGDKVVLMSITEDFFFGYEGLSIGEIYYVADIGTGSIMLPNRNIFLDYRNFILLNEYRESKLKLLLDI